MNEQQNSSVIKNAYLVRIRRNSEYKHGRHLETVSLTLTNSFYFFLFLLRMQKPIGIEF